jgi:hypothetical protein
MIANLANKNTSIFNFALRKIYQNSEVATTGPLTLPLSPLGRGRGWGVRQTRIYNIRLIRYHSVHSFIRLLNTQAGADPDLSSEGLLEFA